MKYRSLTPISFYATSIGDIIIEDYIISFSSSINLSNSE